MTIIIACTSTSWLHHDDAVVMYIVLFVDDDVVALCDGSTFLSLPVLVLVVITIGELLDVGVRIVRYAYHMQ
jgi:hypothetical protein